MAKKPRSQRRGGGAGKKGKGAENNDASDDNPKGDALSDTHTVDDSVAVSLLEDDFAFDETNEEIDDLDFQSTGDTSAEDAMQDRFLRLQDHLNQIEDLPSEKRSARREATLKKAFKALSQYATGEAGQMAVENRQEGIRQACFMGIRSGTAAEQYAACRVLEVTSVILGGDQDEYLESVEKQLTRAVMAQKPTPVRIAALRALAMTNFICSSDDASAEALLDFCEQVAAPNYRNHKVPEILRAAALDCWALLATTISDHHLAGKDDVMIGRGLAILTNPLKECLESNDRDLRAAAGQCFAMIHEARLHLGNDEGENTTHRQFGQGSWEGTPWEELMDEVQQRVEELSHESGRRMTKKAKKEQRATFREFRATLVDDEPPDEVVSFRGGTITLGTWKEIIQLNFIRHCLQGGFQIQLLTNETLQDIFGADGQLLNALSQLTQLEKRLVLSKTSEASKAADVQLTRDRRARNNVKNYFLTADGDDL